MVNFLLQYVFSTFFMLFLWCSVIGMSIFVARKIKVYGVLVLGGAALPFTIFYMYKLFNLWDSYVLAVLYSRFAMVALTVGLIYSLWLMYKVKIDDLE